MFTRTDIAVARVWAEVRSGAMLTVGGQRAKVGYGRQADKLCFLASSRGP